MKTTPFALFPRFAHLAAAAALTLATAAGAAPVVFSGAGANAGDLTGTTDAFRSALGNNLGAGPNAGALPGRREINWDAPALDGVADPNFMPDDQFNRLAAPFARGAQFSTPGDGFFISRRCEQDALTAPCTGPTPLLGFGPGESNSTNFRAFSAQRIFAPVNSNVVDVTFAVPGSPGAPATTTAFGAVFVDVEVADLTTMEFFDPGNQSLGLFSVEASADSGFSFLGVQFTGGERVARVRLTLGDMEILSHGQFGPLRNDLVALDDFIFAEPAAVPAPPVWALLLVGAAAGLARRRRA